MEGTGAHGRWWRPMMALAMAAAWPSLVLRCNILTILVPVYLLAIFLIFEHKNHGAQQNLMTMANWDYGCSSAVLALHYFILSM
jgi:hypothetical protein